MRKESKKAKGFSLIELIVSVSIAAVLMLGMSVFFASTLHNTFITQDRAMKTQGQFTVNEIIRDKFMNLVGAKEPATFPSDHVTIQNQTSKGQLPFTYIGKNGDKLAFKDFFVFNKVYKDGIYGDSGAGQIKNAGDASPVLTLNKNFAGFAKIGTTYYVALPLENKIVKCVPGCSDLVTGLNNPTDVETDGTSLFISDSGNNRILKVDPTTGAATVMVENLNFPTGLAYYTNFPAVPTVYYLFIADTFNNQIKRVETNSGTYPTSAVTIAGGDDSNCDGTALYCKLNLPTGLFADSAKHALYVADTGNNRILKISDPGKLSATQQISFKPNEETTISKIKYTFSNLALALSDINPSFVLARAAYFNNTADSIEAQFFANVSSSECDPPPGPPCGAPPCPCYLKRLVVDHITFQPADPIIVNNANTYVVDSTSEPSNKVILVDTSDETIYSNALVNLNLTWGVDAKFTLMANLSTSVPTGSFIGVKIEVYDNSGVLKQTDYQTLRVGNDILGTPEDKVEVLATGFNFPTGIMKYDNGPPEKLYVANSLAGKIVDVSSGAFTNKQDLNYFSTSDIPAYDYVSDFDLLNLTFNKMGAQILECVIQAKVDADTTQTYTLDAKL